MSEFQLTKEGAELAELLEDAELADLPVDTCTPTIELGDAAALVAFMKGETVTLENMEASLRAVAAIEKAVCEAGKRAWGCPRRENG